MQLIKNLNCSSLEAGAILNELVDFDEGVLMADDWWAETTVSDVVVNDRSCG
jgi:hypothetical protein